MSRICLPTGDKHHWKYRENENGRIRECQGCGFTEQRQENGRYKYIRSTRWVPLTPKEKATDV